MLSNDPMYNNTRIEAFNPNNYAPQSTSSFGTSTNNTTNPFGSIYQTPSDTLASLFPSDTSNSLSNTTSYSTMMPTTQPQSYSNPTPSDVGSLFANSMNDAVTNVSNPVVSMSATKNAISQSANVIASATSAISSDSGILDKLSGFSWKFWLVFGIVLAYLYIELSKTSVGKTINNTFYLIFGKILELFGVTTKNIADTTASGTKTGIDIVNSVFDTTVSAVTNTTSSDKYSYLNDKSGQTQYSFGSPSSNNNKVKNVTVVTKPTDSFKEYEINSTGKLGYCFVGESNGTRTCAEVGANDVCMSGEIFPTKDACINMAVR